MRRGGERIRPARLLVPDARAGREGADRLSVRLPRSLGHAPAMPPSRRSRSRPALAAKKACPPCEAAAAAAATAVAMATAATAAAAAMSPRQRRPTSLSFRVLAINIVTTLLGGDCSENAQGHHDNASWRTSKGAVIGMHPGTTLMQRHVQEGDGNTMMQGPGRIRLRSGVYDSDSNETMSPEPGIC